MKNLRIQMLQGHIRKTFEKKTNRTPQEFENVVESIFKWRSPGVYSHLLDVIRDKYNLNEDT
ncbi:hypothetical protein HZS_6032 [Henneguya salminicola]|nr:hypothetical protein HZS_6032 [Henneguya salminicola]